MAAKVRFVGRCVGAVVLSGVLTIGIVVGASAVVFETTEVDERLQDQFDEAEAWCDEKDGQLVNSQVIGPTGGLHCRLPNGELLDYSQRKGGVPPQ